MDRKTDRRSKKTRAMLQNALAELVNTTPFHKIRVSDITKNCEFNRSTFYAHYNDIYDLLGDCVLDGWPDMEKSQLPMGQIIQENEEHAYARHMHRVFQHLKKSPKLSALALREIEISPYMVNARMVLLQDILEWEKTLIPIKPMDEKARLILAEYILSGEIRICLSFLQYYASNQSSKEQEESLGLEASKMMLRAASVYFKSDFN